LIDSLRKTRSRPSRARQGPFRKYVTTRSIWRQAGVRVQSADGPLGDDTMAEIKLTDLVVCVDQDKLPTPESFLSHFFSTFPSGQHCCGVRNERRWISGASKRSSFRMTRPTARTIANRMQQLKSDEIDFILDGQQRITSICRDQRNFRNRSDGGPAVSALLESRSVVSAAIVEKRHSDLRKEYRQVTEERPPLVPEEEVASANPGLS
jgi:hypothetical protein